VATRGYDSFDPARAGYAVAAARLLAKELASELANFRNALDP
jgi:hypothetical protein